MGLLREIEAAAKQAGWPKEQASNYVKGLTTAHAAIAERQAKAAREAGEKALREDPEFGGDRYEQTLADAKSAVQALGGDALLAELDKTGLGNSPALVKVFANLVKTGVVKGQFVAGGNSRSSGEKSTAAILFDGQ